jgi:hypothetical protein
MSDHNDPFLVDLPSRRRNAEWFAEIYHGNFANRVVHSRRVHYWLLGTKILTPLGQAYQNTSTTWSMLVNASRDARYLGQVPAGSIVDRRNLPPKIYAVEDRPVETGIMGGGTGRIDADFPDPPEYYCYSAPPPQRFFLECWIEKSSMDDILEPLCRSRGVNFVAGAGQIRDRPSGTAHPSVFCHRSACRSRNTGLMGRRNASAVGVTSAA